MESDEKRRGSPPGGGEGSGGGHLCRGCGFQYPNPHPSAKLRRSHRKICGKSGAGSGANGSGKGGGQDEVSCEQNGRELFPDDEGRGGDKANGVLGLLGSAQGNGASLANGVPGMLESAQGNGDLVKSKNVDDGFLEHSSTYGAVIQGANSKCGQNPSTSCNDASQDTTSLTKACTKETAALDGQRQELRSEIANCVGVVNNIENANDGATFVLAISRNPAETSSSLESASTISDEHSEVNSGTSPKDIPCEVALAAEGTDLLTACIDNEKTQIEAGGQFSENASLSAAGPSLEPAISYNEHVDASTSLDQPDSEDGTISNSEGSVEESKNFNVVAPATGAISGEISMQANGSCEGHILREPSMTDLSSNSNAEHEVDNLSSKSNAEHEVDNQMDITEEKHNHLSDECIPALSSVRESSPVLGAEVVSVVSTDGIGNLSSRGMSWGHGSQENGADRSDDTIVPSQAVPAELTISAISQEINVAQSKDDMEGMEENARIISKDITVVQNTDDLEETHNEETTINVVQSTDDLEETHSEETTINVVQSTDDLEEKNEATTINVVQSTDDLQEKNEATTINVVQSTDDLQEKNEEISINIVQSTDDLQDKKIITEEINTEQSIDDHEGKKAAMVDSDKNHVPLKVLLAEANVESKEKKTSAKDRVLSFRRRGSKDDVLSVKSRSPKAPSDHQDWNSPARLPSNNNNTEKRSKARKQPWVPFICCPSIR